MASIMVQHTVSDFATWKKVFDSSVDMRKTAGELSNQLFRDASDPNKVTVINQWKSMADAQKFAHSPELKAAMEKSGVVGQPAIFFLNEV